MITTIKIILSKAFFEATDQDIDVLFSIPPEKFKEFHISTTSCLQYAKKNNLDVADVCKSFCEKLNNSEFIEATEFINGFVNIKFKNEFFTKAVKKCINDGEDFCSIRQEKPLSINLEFCSANPTGPLHIGHLRNTIIGQALSNIIVKNGHNVIKEYYINDGGGQINVLVESVKIRHKQLFFNSQEQIPDGCYPGEYIIEIAKQLPKDINFTLEETHVKIVEIAISQIKSTLEKLNIKYDIFSSEREVIKNGNVEKLISMLKEKGLAFEGTLEDPKSKKTNISTNNKMIIFKSTEFGDEVDRPLTKQEGGYTYLAADGGYSMDKISRNFDKLIYLLGTDHKGYVKRITGITKSIKNDIEVDVKLSELVNYVKNGEQIKMSKRSGNFLSVDDVVELIHPDILKFLILSKKMNTVINFDIEKAQEQSKDNPVFYAQYASSRCSSVLSKIDVKESENPIIQKQLQAIIMKIIFFEEAIKTAYKSLDPHVIAEYINELSGLLHSIWQSDISLKDEENKDILYGTKLTLLSFKNTLSCCLRLLNIVALDKM